MPDPACDHHIFQVAMPAPHTRQSPALSSAELDLISIWGEEAVQSQLRSSRRNYDTNGQISRCMTGRGHDQDTLQCRVKVKELRNAYPKVQEANCCSSAVPMSCQFYKELDAILGDDPTGTCGYLVGSHASREWTEPGGGNLGQRGGGNPEAENDSEARDACSPELFSTPEEPSQSQQSDLGEAQTGEEVPEMTLGAQPPSLL
ncbi:uncharacterized protein LOC128832672 [Malaclemys terrapin pileata]|uniref:uncharacterized protein LOC128832672 n=1 Tax=Malaclemys terrapin pileata TaxID=2991368 RepID=UPI0023A8E8E9|nr:uncharacterized protein LOC128832672 [Malaclemys terrapin pileata]